MTKIIIWQIKEVLGVGNNPRKETTMKQKGKTQHKAKLSWITNLKAYQVNNHYDSLVWKN